MLKQKLDLYIRRWEGSIKFATYSTQLPIHIQKIINNKGWRDLSQGTNWFIFLRQLLQN